MPKKKKSTVDTTLPAHPVPYATLTGLLGKPVTDPAVTELLATLGPTEVDRDFIVAKEAGFDVGLEAVEGQKKPVLHRLFLFQAGGDDHRGYADLPRGVTFSDRSTLMAALGKPWQSWCDGEGSVPATRDDVDRDTWLVGSQDMCANYRGDDKTVQYFTVTQATSIVGEPFDTHPLHFSTKPTDAVPDAELVGMAILVAWAGTRVGLPPKHADTALGKQLRARSITPLAFLKQACGGTLSSLDFVPELFEFIDEYQHHRKNDKGTRDAAHKEIGKLLGLEKGGDRTYDTDYLATFAKVVKNPFYVPDSWAAVDRMGAVIEARRADFDATTYLTPPDLGIYKRAASERDRHTVEPMCGERAAVTVPEGLADELVGLLGKSMKDAAVKALFKRVDLPIGKTIDMQANPAIGVAYMGTKFDIDGKRQLGVECIYFHSQDSEAYVRGMGKKVSFDGFPGPLPGGITWADARAGVVKKLTAVFGAPADKAADYDYWKTAERRVAVRYAGGKLQEIIIGLPTNY